MESFVKQQFADRASAGYSAAGHLAAGYPSPAPVAEIPRELDYLEQSIKELHACLDELANKSASVARQPAPLTENASDSPICATAIGQRISMATRQINLLSKGIIGLSARMEV